MKKSNLFKIVNGVKVYASFYKEIKKDENGNLYVGSTGGYFVEDGRGGTMFLYWDIAVIYAEFISYGLTPREAWEAACAFFDDPDHARVNYVPGLIIDTCQNKGRAAAVIEAREAAANVSEEKESAEETPAEEVEFIDNVTTAYHHTTAERIATIARTIAGAVGACFGSSLPVSDMAIDVNRFNKWCEGSSVADADASAPFWFAVRKQGSESGTRENCQARCKALGSPLYVLKVEREAAGLFSLTVRVSTRQTAEEITAATIKRAEAREEAKEAENTADDAQAAESSAAVVPAAVDAIKAAFKKVPALLVRFNVLVLRVLLIALLFAGAFALVPLTGNTVAGLVGSGVLPLLFITVPCVFAVCFVWGYANVKMWDALCIFK